MTDPTACLSATFAHHKHNARIRPILTSAKHFGPTHTSRPQPAQVLIVSPTCGDGTGKSGNLSIRSETSTGRHTAIGRLHVSHSRSTSNPGVPLRPDPSGTITTMFEHDDEPVIMYFGGRWDSHLFEAAQCVQVQTPTGRDCVFCEHRIVDGDRGQYVGGVKEVDGALVPTMEVFHIECQVLNTSGHMYGICGCTGFDDKDPATRAALVEAVDRSRASEGLGPWFTPEP